MKSLLEVYDLKNLTDALTIEGGSHFRGFKNDKSFEAEVNEIIMKRFPNSLPNSIYLPHELFSKRTMTLGSSLASIAQPGFRFLPELTEVKFSEPLYKKIGVEEFDIDKGRLSLPVNPTAPEAEWLPEQIGPENINDIDLTDFETVIPIRLQVVIEFSKIADILLQPAGINLLITILKNAIDKKLDTTIFYGDSNNFEPDGIINNDSVQGIPAGVFNLETAALFIKTVEDASADFDELFFVGSPSVREELSTREISTGSGQIVLSNGRIADVPFKSNANITGTDIFCGAFSTIILFKFFGGVELHVNPYSKDTEGITRMILTLYANFTIRNGALIVHGTDFS